MFHVTVFHRDLGCVDEGDFDSLDDVWKWIRHKKYHFADGYTWQVRA